MKRNARSYLGGVQVIHKDGNTQKEIVLYKEEYSMAKKKVQNIKHVTHVGASMGLTMNLGNFEWARIDVWLQVPCDPANTDSAYKEATEWIEQRVSEQRDAVRKIHTS